MNSKQGSLWRKWDLHIHTPSSIEQQYGGDESWDKFISALENLPVEVKVIGITDYYFIDGYAKVMNYKKKGRLKNIDKIFPILEFRIDTFGSGNENQLQKINLHILLNLDENILDSEIKAVKEEFIDMIPLSSIRKHQTKKLSRENFISEGGNLSDGFKSFIPPTKQVLECIKSDKWKGKTILLAGYKEWSNLEKNQQLKPLKEELFGNARAFFSSNFDNYTANQDWLNKYGTKKLLHSLDIHDFKDLDTYELDDKSQILPSINYFCNTWIKADPTFQGLKMALLEPEKRIFIGDEPAIEIERKSSAEKFITKLIIKKTGTNPTKEIWFQDTEIDLNPELVAVIGNKGSGKSALVDVVGLLGNAHIENMDTYFSFLNFDRFKDAKRGSKAKDFEAELIWQSSLKLSKNLGSDINTSTTEYVKYIPQKYFEKLCNDNNTLFEKELKNVIFAHIDDVDRDSNDTLDKLLTSRVNAIETNISLIKNEIEKLNKQVILLEEKSHINHKEHLARRLEEKKQELALLQTNKPKVIVKPEEDEAIKNQQEKIKSEIRLETESLDKLEKEQEDVNLNLKNLNSKIESVKQIRNEISNLARFYKTTIDTLTNDLQKLGITSEDIITFQIEDKKLGEIELNVKEAINKLLPKNDPERSESLKNKILRSKTQLDTLNKQLSVPNREYQQYLNSKAQYELKEKQVQGNEDIPDSIKYLEKELGYVTENLKPELDNLYKDRTNKLEDIFKEKNKILKIYKTLYLPVQNFINKYNSDNPKYQVKFNAELKIHNFRGKFLSHVDISSLSELRTKDNAYTKIDEKVDSTIADLNGIKELVNYSMSMLGSINETERFKQLKGSFTLFDLYNYIYSLEYLVPGYKLKLGNTDMELLSPGEKGALLIIFYLLVDKSTKPLVIDQPEENLDNESVFELMVRCIKEAKSRRQIILVTHNPNIAVVCDAEQIIYSEIDKPNGHKVTYISGSLENPNMKDLVVKVLEGTKPAFDNRKLKYDE
jgi:ABC-type lipoprotein export system ATPase subunit